MKLRLFSAVMLASLLTLSFAAGGGSAERPIVPDHVMQQAMSLGTARVIVQLNTPFSVDAEMMGGAHAAVQRQNIAATREWVKRGLKAYKHRIAREYQALPYLAVEAGPDALQMLEAMKGAVVSVHEDALDRVTLAQSGPVVQAPQAWAVGADGTGSIVAILDTGVLKTHPFLTGKVIAEACFSTTYAPWGSTSVCPGGAGTSTAAGSGLPCPSTVEGCDHGTHVAGIVAGGTTGTLGSGIAPGAKIIAVQVFSRFPASFCGGTACALSFTSDQIAALEYIRTIQSNFPGKTISSVNMSLGGSQDTSNCDGDQRKGPIDLLRAAGIATVIASGNDGYTNAISTPGCISTAVSVGSTNDGSFGTIVDQVSSFSNSASFLSLLAPGMWIYSSVPTWSSATGFANFAGTSMATPHVAAAFAILRQMAPTASVTTLLSTLQSTGTPVLDTRNSITKPRIDIYDAVAALAAPDLIVSALSAPPANVVPGTNVSVNYTVRNRGFSSSNVSTVAFYLSADSTITTGDTFLGQASVPALTTGLRSADTISLTIPASTPAGTFFIGAIADITDTTAESNEANNTRASTAFHVVRPDLVVSAITAPTPVAAGQRFVVSTTVKNNSAAVVAPASTMSLYLASTPALPLSGGELLLGTRNIPALPVSGTSTGTTSVTIPANQSVATYYLVGVADSADVIDESNEANNARATPGIKVVRPDVTVAAATTVAGAAPGGTIVVSNTIKNNAIAPVGTFTVGFYLSSDGMFDGGDRFLVRRTVPSLTAGALSTAATNVTIPADTVPGTWRIIVRADDGDALVESNEGNNTLPTSAINVVRADLRISSVTAPAAVFPGASVPVTIGVRNIASPPGNATASTTATLYFSDNNDPAKPPGIVLGNRSVPGILAGATVTSTANVTVPNVGLGTYYVRAAANVSGSVFEQNTSNNVGFSAPIVIGPDWKMTSVTAPLLGAANGSVTVGFAGKNIGTAANASVTGFFLTTNPAFNPITPPASQSAISSPAVAYFDGMKLGTVNVGALAAAATFSGTKSLLIPADTPPNRYYIVASANDGYLPEANFNNNHAHNAIPIRIGPDLLVSSATTVTATSPGRTITVNNTVKNNSLLSIPSTFAVAFYLSSDATVDGLDVLLRSRSVAGLAAGAVNTAATAVTIPSDTQPGSYRIIVRVDNGEAVTEANESNNTLATAAFSIIRPDLIVPAVSVPILGAQGANISVTSTIKNNAAPPATAPASTASIYLADNGNPAGSWGTFLGNRSVPLLAPGVISTAATTVTLPNPLPPGIYYVKVVADRGALVTEANEANNVGVSNAIVVGPDLKITAATAPSAAAPGATVGVNRTVINAGGERTGSPFSLGFYLSTGANLSFTNTFLTSVPISALARGAGNTSVTNVVIPSDTAAGTYRIVVTADDGGAIPEAKEGNNFLATAPIAIVRPDLIVPTVTAPALGIPGGNVSVTNTIKNNSPAPGAAGASIASFYLSGDNNPASLDTFLANRSVPALAPAATSTATTVLRLPNLAPSRYYVKVVADGGAGVTETREGNNVGVSNAILVGPDLFVVGAAAPAAMTPGSTISVSHTIKNAGSQSTGGPFVLGFYLSTGGNFSLPGTFLGSRLFSALTAGASNVSATSLFIPADTVPGAYRILVSVDDNGDVDEGNETNNVFATATVNVALADLSVSAVTTPTAAKAGQSITVNNTVKNNAPSLATAVASTASLYLASNNDVSTLGAAQFLANRSVPALAPLATSAVPRSVVLPNDVPAGIYYIKVLADAGDVVAESNELNNIGVSNAILVGPDLTISALTVPAFGVAERTIGIPNTVKNNAGIADVGSPFSVGLYLSDDGSITPGLDALLANRSVPSLVHLAVASATTPVTLPASQGNYYIGGMADDGSVIGETNESNNTLARPIGVVIEMARSELGVMDVFLTGCSYGNNGPVTEYMDFSIAASSQTNAAPRHWLGTAVADDGVYRDTFSMSGTVHVNGNVNGTLTFTLKYFSAGTWTTYAAGNGTFTGTTTANSFNTTVIGHFTSGETCTFTGTFDQL